VLFTDVPVRVERVVFRYRQGGGGEVGRLTAYVNCLNIFEGGFGIRLISSTPMVEFVVWLEGDSGGIA
jgi:hypothetical protein